MIVVEISRTETTWITAKEMCTISGHKICSKERPSFIGVTRDTKPLLDQADNFGNILNILWKKKNCYFSF